MYYKICKHGLNKNTRCHVSLNLYIQMYPLKCTRATKVIKVPHVIAAIFQVHNVYTHPACIYLLKRIFLLKHPHCPVETLHFPVEMLYTILSYWSSAFSCYTTAFSCWNASFLDWSAAFSCWNIVFSCVYSSTFKVASVLVYMHCLNQYFKWHCLIYTLLYLRFHLDIWHFVQQTFSRLPFVAYTICTLDFYLFVSWIYLFRPWI